MKVDIAHYNSVNGGRGGRGAGNGGGGAAAGDDDGGGGNGDGDDGRSAFANGRPFNDGPFCAGGWAPFRGGPDSGGTSSGSYPPFSGGGPYGGEEHDDFTYGGRRGGYRNAQDDYEAVSRVSTSPSARACVHRPDRWLLPP